MVCWLQGVRWPGHAFVQGRGCTRHRPHCAACICDSSIAPIAARPVRLVTTAARAAVRRLLGTPC